MGPRLFIVFGTGIIGFPDPDPFHFDIAVIQTFGQFLKEITGRYSRKRREIQKKVVLVNIL
jgi:hypothetical protein